MQEFFKSKLFKILLTIVACLIGFVTYEIFSDDNTILKTSMKIIMQPIIKTANYFNDSVANFFDEFFKHGIHKEENVLLKKELAKNQKKLIEIDQLKTENEKLKQALDFKQENSNYDIVMANFIAADPNSVYSFTIDVGKNKNIPLGAAVLTNLGLVGKVTKVEATHSVVTNILNLDDKIPANVNLKQEKGLVCGDVNLLKKGLCIMSHLSKNTSAAIGDLIYTAGVNNTYPENIVIGTIIDIKLNSNGISKDAIIKPSQNLNDLKELIVIKKYVG